MENRKGRLIKYKTVKYQVKKMAKKEEEEEAEVEEEEEEEEVVGQEADIVYENGKSETTL